MINIVCLKWGTKYSAAYVNRLYYAVERHTTKDFQFWCFTEDTNGIDVHVKTLPLQYPDQLESWWNKISLFDSDNGLPLGEQIFYVDLDTLIVDNIDQLLTDVVPDIIVLRDFYHGIARTAGKIGSGLMSWRHGNYDTVWREFIQNPKAAIASVYPHGDQHWVESQIDAWYYWQDLFPDAVVSFKMHCQQGIPQGSRIICYHGNPGIPESVTFTGRDWRWKLTPQPWVLDHWRDQ